MITKKIVSILSVIVLLIMSAGGEAGRGKTSRQLTDDELYNGIYGAMYGKCIGLILGQPVEGHSKQLVERKLRKVNAYPLEYYFPADFDTGHKKFLQGSLDGAPRNDDTTLMMASFVALRNQGIDLTTRDIAQAWVDHVKGACTAEGIALMNMRKKGIWPPESAIVDNPYRQWIGAQMRADIWGMIAPGMPKVAAEYAEKDAVITHIRNGVYGAQFMAAAVSIAMVENNPRTIVTEALKVIPAHSDYDRVVRDALQCYDEGKTWRQAWEVLDYRYGYNDDGTCLGDFVEERFNTRQGRYQWENRRRVHVIPNAGSCVLGILYGKGDFSQSICITVMCGYDADCNAGTVGAVMGAMIGEKNIPEKWKAPIHDDFDPALKCLPENFKLSKLSAEIAGFAKQVIERQNNSKNAATDRDN
ncbi:MAG: ADP-ribosylglycohydrolase family protein [Planctomycetota bacterium]|jgi:ADP-ribosylglycohydrolase